LDLDFRGVKCLSKDLIFNGARIEFKKKDQKARLIVYKSKALHWKIFVNPLDFGLFFLGRSQFNQTKINLSQ